MLKPKHYVAFGVSVVFWLAATWYFAWYCDITGRTHLARIGLQIAGMVAMLGLYVLRTGAGFIGSRYGPPERLRRKDYPGVWQIGLGILAAAAACALFSLLFLI
jgi:hypothetical protein